MAFGSGGGGVRQRKMFAMRLRSVRSTLLLSTLLACLACLASLLACVAPPSLYAQEEGSRRHGRKYKAPPDLTHIEVYVIKQATGKPVANAAVVFRATRLGKDDGNLEMKTDPDGKAAIDVIERGSNVQVQVIANGLATFAESYQVDEPSREIHIELVRPQKQVSAYEDNAGKESERKPGVQEPRTPPKPKPAPPATLQPGPKPDPNGQTPAPQPTNPPAPQP